MRQLTIIYPLVSILLVFGCGESVPRGDADTPTVDAGADGEPSDADLSDGDDDFDVPVESDADISEDGGSDLPIECGYPELDRYGFRIGRVMEPFTLWNCEGEETNLPRLWCGNRATIIHLAVAWCGSCYSTIHDLQTEVMPELEGEGVALVEVLLEDDPGEVADREVCQWWSEYFDPPLETHIPADGAISGPLLELVMTEALPLTFVIDSEGVIRIWSPATVTFDFADQVLELL